MGSSDYSEELREQLEKQLADLGKRLTKLPSSKRELLALLKTAERVLSEVWQAPPKSTADALVPTMQAMVGDELLRHSDVDVQTTLASCLSEITRITVPDAPYPEELMKDIFQLFMVALKYLPSGSGRNYLRGAWILQTMAVVRYCLIMLDLELDAMVVEMFQLFFDTLRSDQPAPIVNSIEMIVIMMINESEEVSVELLMPLLDSVRLENENVYPVAWNLGKTVLEKCATQLQNYLGEAVKLLNLDVDDYADIVATICNNTSIRENMVAEEVVAAGPSGDGVSAEGVSELKRIFEAEQENCIPQLNDRHENILDNENSSETLRCSQQIVEFEGDNARPDAEVVNIAEIGQPETETDTETGGFRRIRSRKPNTLMRPEEGYEHSWMIGWSTRQRSRSNKKKSMMILDCDPEQSTKPRRKIQKSGVKETGTKSPQKMEKGEGTHSGTDSDHKAELLLQELDERKVTDDEIISRKPELEDDEDEMVGSSVSKPESEDSAPEKEKKSPKSGGHYGEELVNARISVWWPLDKTFYTGTVESFDPLTKKHKIKYDDDEEEILNLEEERWEFFNERKSSEIQTSSKQEADNPSPAQKPVKTEKKTSKRKASKPQQAASLSKRAKTEGSSFLKSGKSPFRYINLNEDSDDDLL
ncbi:hypothetical protein CDL12_24107 [Handroanthus impetiginosus]|uniref:Uncharacterized protein n=1 Tax=Handroanthus impetiginosus TaxID=429701 RepID=A0A2G9GDJ6_9LAMI|nr:hypothetical protein CDL12_24107 [Handroanthus impetiginosus]